MNTKDFQKKQDAEFNSFVGGIIKFWLLTLVISGVAFLSANAETAPVQATATFVKVCPKGTEKHYDCKRGQKWYECKVICKESNDEKETN